MKDTQERKMEVACEAADSFLSFYFEKEINQYDEKQKSLMYTKEAQWEFDHLYDQLMGRIEFVETQDLSVLQVEEGDEFQQYVAYDMEVPPGTAIGLMWHEEDNAKIYLFNEVEYDNN